MPSRSFEAGTLRIFQLFAGIQLGVLLYILVIFLTGLHPDSYHSVAQLVLMTGVAAALFGYLLLPWLRVRLGGAYLPVALGLSLCAPVLGQGLLCLERPGFAEYLSVNGELALFSLLPLLLASWRYRFRYVAAICAGLGLADFGLTWLAYPGDSRSIVYDRLVLTRVLGYLAIGYILTRLMREQRAQRAALKLANTNLTHYAATLEQLTVARERARLARELHDTLAHTLSGLAVQLEGIRAVWDTQPGRARGLLDQALTATRDGLVETRRALRDMRAAPLDDLGLHAAIGQCAERAAARCGAALDLDLAPADQVRGLPPDVAQGLYRVAQEALENVVRHARAGRVWVRLERSGGRLVLAVRDDGCGFDPSGVNTPPHLGLRGLRERAELVGGHLEVDSRPATATGTGTGTGTGTTVTLTLDT